MADYYFSCPNCRYGMRIVGLDSNSKCGKSGASQCGHCGETVKYKFDAHTRILTLFSQLGKEIENTRL